VSQIKKAGVLGAGMMGSEIGLCFAMAGIEVVMKDITMDLVKGGTEKAGKALDRLVKKGQFDLNNKEKVLSLIHGTVDCDLFPDLDIVVEAVVEDLKIKKNASRE